MTLAIGVVLMAALVPMLAPMTQWRLPRLSAVSGKAAMTAAGSAGSGRRCGLVCERSRSGQSGERGEPVPYRRRQILAEGRAYAMGADTLRVGGATIKLTGIDAPESEQRCGTGSRAWRCGAAGRRGVPVEARQRPQLEMYVERQRRRRANFGSVRLRR